MNPVADVCLLLEGSYPYVAGGVSTWVHNLISALPDITFTGVCIMPSAAEAGEPRYALPDNFSIARTIYVHESEPLKRTWVPRMTKKDIENIRALHGALHSGDDEVLLRVITAFQSGKFPLYELMHGRKSWKLMLEQYQPETSDDSFLDFFWTFRFSHLPLFRILMNEVPRARVYHSLCTGFAGMLGVVAKLLYDKPLLLTEHGIYTKERKIEISQAEWAATAEDQRLRLRTELGAYQKFWIRMFQSLGKLCYRHANRIVTLYDGNRQMEIAEGADQRKIDIIPNGINLERFQAARTEPRRRGEGPLTIGFVGRVVPIKDVKTFLRACKSVLLRMPDVEVLIMGPTEEDPEYYAECVELARTLRIDGNVTFTGSVRIVDYFPRLDVVVLTSVSEAQPLVVLEANCAGIPVVAADVGSCRELLEGRTDEDRALGPSGIVTGVADPEETAEGILAVLGDFDLRRRMSRAGVRRVETFYREQDLNEKYRTIYEAFMHPGAAPLPDADTSPQPKTPEEQMLDVMRRLREGDR